MARSNQVKWAGLTVGKRALDNWRKGGSDRNFINNILKYNRETLGSRQVGNEILGTENPKATLTNMFKEIRSDFPNRQLPEGRRRRQNIHKAIETDLGETIRSSAYTAKSERVPQNFKDLVTKTMSKEERKDLRKFLGWKGGYDVSKGGFEWNSDSKRFERTYTDSNGNVRTQWYRYHTKGKNVHGEKYANKEIEYGEE